MFLKTRKNDFHGFNWSLMLCIITVNQTYICDFTILAKFDLVWHRQFNDIFQTTKPFCNQIWYDQKSSWTMAKIYTWIIQKYIFGQSSRSRSQCAHGIKTGRFVKYPHCVPYKWCCKSECHCHCASIWLLLLFIFYFILF